MLSPLNTTASQPLAGISILDLSRLLPGPMATLMLADMGAHVTKIEEPGGDPARAIGPAAPGMPSHFFQLANRGKTLLRLDFKQAAQREQFLSMVERADVVIESFRPGVMARLGLGWDTLKARNPQLVLCSISGYGQNGPMAAMAGHDINYLASAGILEQIAGTNGKPVLPNLQIADLLGGAQTAVQGVLAALLAVKMGGSGRCVDVSMSHASFGCHVMPLVAVKSTGQSAAPGLDLLTGGVACYNIYRTADARFMAVGALELKFWEVFCSVIGRSDLAPRHWTRGQPVGGTEAQSDIEELGRLFATHDLAYWTALFADADCCVSPVLRTDEALRSGLFATNADDVLGNGIKFLF